MVAAAGSIDVATVGFKTAPQVTAIRTDGGGPGAPIVGAPRGNEFTLRNLSPGSYTIIARTSSEAASVTVQVAAGRASRTTLTSSGSAVVAGHVREFRTGKPIEGMTCRALPRSDTGYTAVGAGEGVRTDAQGAFVIATAPAGPISLSCDGLWRNYSDGLRMITLQPGKRSDIDVPVVALSEEPGITLGGIGADFDPSVLVPRLLRVQPGGPAAIAGFQNGDVITTVDGTSVAELSPNGVWTLIVNRAPGTKIKLVATRGGKSVAGEIALGEAPH